VVEGTGVACEEGPEGPRYQEVMMAAKKKSKSSSKKKKK
jgi:hypothetical protein